MRAVGYRQAWQYLANELEESQFVANALTATRRLAKRQLTWMRQWLILKSLDMDEPHRLSEQIFTEVVKT
jgi:tRNA dimethylallyltransferase